MSLLRSKTFFTAIILVLGGLTAVNAQIAPGTVMRANMPMSFVVNGKMLPAGHYVIQRLRANAEPDQLFITDRLGNHAIIIGQYGELSLGAAAHDALVLRRVGGQYYLSQILYAGQFTGLEVSLPKAEKEYYGRNKSERIVIPTTTE